MLTKNQIQHIQNLGKRSSRDETGTFVAEGPKAVEEFLTATTIQPGSLFALADWYHAHRQLLDNCPIPCSIIGERDLQRISFQKTSNQVIGIFGKPIFETSVTPESALVLALDDIQDPGNLGTIIRCADWFGISHIYCSPKSVDAFSPKVVQATMGSLARVQVTVQNITELFDLYPQSPLYAATLNGKNVYNQASITHGILIIGNESRGVHPDILSRTLHKLSIPRQGQAESLNAGVATGIILSHIMKPNKNGALLQKAPV